MTVGYSGTPLAKKLGIKDCTAILTVNAPENYAELLEPLPAKVEINDVSVPRLQKLPRSNGEIDLIHIFTNTREGLFQSVSDAKQLIKQDGAIWVSWYKKASKLPTEITEDTVREAAFPLGLVDAKVCAVDEKWSGLKLVIRKENRV